MLLAYAAPSSILPPPLAQPIVYEHGHGQPNQRYDNDSSSQNGTVSRLHMATRKGRWSHAGLPSVMCRIGIGTSVQCDTQLGTQKLQ